MVNMDAFMGGATGAASISVIIKAVDSYISELKKAQSSLQKFGSVAKVAVLTAAGALVAFGVKAVQSAAESERVAFRIKQSFGDMADSVLEASSDMQAASVESDEVIGQAFVDLQRRTESLGLTFSQQSDIIQGALDLSAKTGMEFNSVVEAISGGLTGMTRSLKQLGIELDDGASKADVYNAIMGKISGASGAAEEKINTFEGAIANLTNQWDEVFETVGNNIIPILMDLAGALKDNKDVIIDLGTAFGTAIGTILGWIGSAGKLIWEWFNKGAMTVGRFVAQLKATYDFIKGDTSWEDYKEQLGNIETVYQQNIDNASDFYAELTKQNQVQKEVTKTTLNESLALNNNSAAILDNAKAADKATKSQQSLGNAMQKALSYIGAAPGQRTSSGALNLVGLGKGTYNADKGTFTSSSSGTTKVGDFILRPNGELIETSPQDTIVGVKDTNKLGGFNIQIGAVYGVNADDIAKSMARELRAVVSY